MSQTLVRWTAVVVGLGAAGVAIGWIAAPQQPDQSSLLSG